jgi:hypothetical protein
MVRYGIGGIDKDTQRYIYIYIYTYLFTVLYCTVLYCTVLHCTLCTSLSSIQPHKDTSTSNSSIRFNPIQFISHFSRGK